MASHGTLILATLLGFTLPEAASIGVIGAIDGFNSNFRYAKTSSPYASSYRGGSLLLHRALCSYHPTANYEITHHARSALSAWIMRRIGFTL